MCKFIIAQEGENVKKEKTIEEYYCDFCGRECTEEHYDVALPFKQTDGYTSRFAPETSDDNSIAIHKLNLCAMCARINAQTCTFLSNACRRRVDVRQTAEIDLSDPAFKKDPWVHCVTLPKIDNTMILNYQEVR